MKIIKNAFLLLSVAALFASCSNTPQANTEDTTSTPENIVAATDSNDDIQVIQFHSEHRCMTCNKIESLTRETLLGVQELPFSLVNVDDDANEEQTNSFEAAGTALFLYNPKTGAKKDLTDFAFMNASNDEEFKEGLAAEIEAFKQE